MSRLLRTRARVTIGVRRTVARRPWLQWVVIVVLAAAVTRGVHDRIEALDAQRGSWGETVHVWTSEIVHGTGDDIVAVRMPVPVAIAPDGAVDLSPAGLAARRHIGRGEIITEADVMGADDEHALVPTGWLITPIDESPRSGATLGEEVQVVSGGYVLADRAVVIGFHDDVILVAIPSEVAPLVPAAAETADVTLLRVP